VRNQDDEHNLRITQMGGRIWQSSKIRSWYYPRSSLCSLFRQYFQYGYWKVRVIQKHHMPASLRHLIPGLFVLSVMLFATCALISPYGLMLFGCDLLAYGLFVSVATCFAAKKGGLSLLPALPVIIATYQVSYGVGFLLGVFDFVILRRSGRYKKVNR
jgi:succinoglycan biosynthesis protein ExoA